MKIAIVTTSYPAFEGDAAGHFVLAETRALCRAGHQVTVITPQASPRFDETAPSDTLGNTYDESTEPRVVRCAGGSAFGFPGALFRIKQNPLRVVAAARFAHSARQALQTLGPFERVVAHWLVPSVWPISLASSAPLEAVAHGSDVRSLLALPRPLRRALLRAIGRRAQRVRCASSELAGLLIAECPALSERISVEPSPLELDTTGSRAAARSALGLGADERLVVIAARLIPSKRVEVALGAATLLQARTVVLGDGPERRRLEHAFPKVQFLGQQPRTTALNWIQAADVLLNASSTEGAPTAIREARALGTRVVSVACGDLSSWAARDDGLVVISS
jgi:teichuronic acid biosynthesis glycosyltransferase TuaC